jgi:hypothetical protein
MTFEVKIRRTRARTDGLSYEHRFETTTVEAESEEDVFAKVKFGGCWDGIASIRTLVDLA